MVFGTQTELCFNSKRMVLDQSVFINFNESLKNTYFENYIIRTQDQGFGDIDAKDHQQSRFREISGHYDSSTFGKDQSRISQL